MDSWNLEAESGLSASGCRTSFENMPFIPEQVLKICFQTVSDFLGKKLWIFLETFDFVRNVSLSYYSSIPHTMQENGQIGHPYTPLVLHQELLVLMPA